jgi:hypothetical protein
MISGSLFSVSPDKSAGGSLSHGLSFPVKCLKPHMNFIHTSCAQIIKLDLVIFPKVSPSVLSDGLRHSGKTTSSRRHAYSQCRRSSCHTWSSETLRGKNEVSGHMRRWKGKEAHNSVVRRLALFQLSTLNFQDPCIAQPKWS